MTLLWLQKKQLHVYSQAERKFKLLIVFTHGLQRTILRFCEIKFIVNEIKKMIFWSNIAFYFYQNMRTYSQDVLSEEDQHIWRIFRPIKTANDWSTQLFQPIQFCYIDHYSFFLVCIRVLQGTNIVIILNSFTRPHIFKYFSAQKDSVILQYEEQFLRN
jgi:hypothetical protein